MDSRYRTASDLVASVETLLTLPDVYLRVKAVVEDPDSYLTDLVNAISVDPGITARVLRMVNSAYFHLGAPVDNVRQAVNLLGMRPVHDLVLATTLTSSFAQAGGDTRRMRELWILSVHRGVYARLVARACAIEDNEGLFVAGLLSHIGHQLMYLQLPEQTEGARHAAAHADAPLARTETGMLGFNYADVGAELMHAWELPQQLVATTRGHIDPNPVDECAPGTAVVHIATALTRLDGEPIDEAQLMTEISPAAWQITGLQPDDLLALPSAAAEELDAAIGMLLAG